ncbi:glycerol-3-phosphate dehydrogenase/oxidase [Reichenbachiella sp. MALMAid0571]|uniref:glycerol-3-phosphate dehydrogenase/oxidase n=1 Tax=Reichenbachiella sp. MALMAid0571 TaxID=3143939 RepID=UPI0032DE9B3A
MSFSAQDRPQIIKSLEKEYYDIIIIGGGITGAGIALDAASRGLKVALVEKGDFASGTSSKSTKLIHGGLRYLKQFEFSLVREVGKERAIVHHLAPHLVRPEKMLLPLITNGNYGHIMTSVGLMVYDVLANVDKEDQRKMLSKDETMKLEPLLKDDVVEGGGLYAEYQTDDFRLVIEVIKASMQYQAYPINYVEVEEILEKGGIAYGVKCKDKISDKSIEILGDYIINATGPWVDLVRSKIEKIEGKSLHLTKGVHIVVPHEKLPVKHSVYFDVSDGRMIFAIPKNDITYIGTTDTEYSGDPGDAQVNQKDVDYILDAVDYMFPSIHLQKSDIVSSWAGIRPLIAEEGKSASEISRKDELFVADNGLISIAGGKLTGYRQMAKKVVVAVLEKKEKKSGIKKKRKCKTRKIPLPGNEFEDYTAVKKYKNELKKNNSSFNPSTIDYLVDIYGTQTNEIIKNAKEQDENRPDIQLLKAEINFCLENEMVMTLLDFYERRTGRIFFKIQTINDTLEVVLSIMAKYLGWDESRVEEELKQLNNELKLATNFK